MQYLFLAIVSLYLFFLPGFFISYLFYKGKRLDLIERGILSFALSIIGVTLVISYSNFVGIPLNAISIMIQVTILLFVVALIFLIQHKRKKL